MAGTFKKIGWDPLFEFESKVSLRVLDAPASYNIPTGVQYYDIKRDFAEFPDWVEDLMGLTEKIPKAGKFLKAFYEIFKSGVPKLLTKSGDINVTLNHTDIDMFEPGRAYYWFQVQLESKTTQAIQV